MKVEIKCKGAAVAEVDKLIPFQGDLKDLSKENYQKLRKEILELGFSEPISVWRTDDGDYILNGHQRVRTLQQMREEGIEVPHIPINIVDADNEKDAKRKVLSLTSQYGEMTGQGLYEFMAKAELDLSEIDESFRFPEIDMDKFREEFFDIEPDGDPFSGVDGPSENKLHQMSFIVTDQQENTVKLAISASIALGDFGETGNENKNGNAIARICEVFLGQC